MKKQRPKWIDSIDPIAATNFIQEVQRIYDQNNGEPIEKPQLSCFSCGEKTTNYGCAWGLNNHVHFSCEHCGLNMMM